MATQEEILEAIANMTVLEVADLIKAMEEKFGVTAAAPVAVVAGGAGAAGAADAAEEKNQCHQSRSRGQRIGSQRSERPC